MGGIVASEALLQGAPVHTYAACQTAMAAHAYDANATSRANLLLDPIVWETPEVYADYPLTSEPYYKSIVPKVFNFHNVDDDALKGWQYGQTFKPNDAVHAIPEFYFAEKPLIGSMEYYHKPHLILKTDLTFPENRYEIFAHCSEARSYALGAVHVPGAKGNFNLNAGFSDPSYNFLDHKKDHSGQFNATMMLRHEFWEVLLQDAFGIQPN